jgi:hypothetical protein
VGNSVDLLQESLVAALRTEPLLIRAEEFLHSAQSRDVQDQLANNLARLLDPDLAIAEIDRRQYRGLDGGLIEKFRAAMQSAVTGGATLADSESQILESFGLSKVGELRTAMQSHLGGPAELPEQDLAIYVPKGDRKQEDFHRALRRDLQALEAALDEPETGPAEEELELATALSSDGEPAPLRDLEAEIPAESPVEIPAALPDSIQSPSTVIASPATVAPVTGATEAATDLRPAQGLAAIAGSAPGRLAKLNPIPMLTAALEAVGLGGEGFGFVLRYGRYAPEGRKSQFLVGGLGLADLSKRLTGWLEAQGPLDGQVQVIDEGSGELTIYLLLPEAA